MQPAETILIVDDDDVLRQRLEKSLTRRGWTIFAAEGFETAIALAETHQPTRAVLDLKMPGQSGLDVLQKIREISPNTKCVILTGYGSITNAVEAVKLGAVGYITKPADADQVLAAFAESRETPTPDFPRHRWPKHSGNTSSGYLRIPAATFPRQLADSISLVERFSGN